MPLPPAPSGNPTTKKAIDLYIVYQFIKRLTTPFENTEAFRLGIIDREGKQLKKRATLKSEQERAAYTYFDALVFNLKRLIIKLGGESKIVTYAAAILLIKEQHNKTAAFYTEERLCKKLNRELKELRTLHLTNNRLEEEAPTNNMGGGQIKGAADVGRKRFIRRFANKDVFPVSGEKFEKARLNRRKMVRYEEYIDDDDVGKEIVEYGNRFPTKPIILLNQHTGATLYLRYGSVERSNASN